MPGFVFNALTEWMRTTTSRKRQREKEIKIVRNEKKKNHTNKYTQHSHSKRSEQEKIMKQQLMGRCALEKVSLLFCLYVTAIYAHG